MIDFYDDFEENNEEELIESKEKKKFLGILFDCCGVYARIYQNKEGTAYVGRCPKCMRQVKILIGKEGTGQRFFRGH